MDMSNHIKSQIMRRVYMLYVMRSFTSPFAYKMYAFFVLLAAASMGVSFVHVWANMPRFNDPRVFSFSVNAFEHTELFEKILAVGIFVTIGLAIRDIVRSFPHITRGVRSVVR